jgi:uncharacterized membrane protein YdjX (TVP38/TMEM64 family)
MNAGPMSDAAASEEPAREEAEEEPASAEDEPEVRTWSPSPELEARERRNRNLRFLALALLTVALIGGAKALGLKEYLTAERIQSLMEAAGAWGVLAYFALFAVGELAHLPGMLFVGVARVAYGPYWGFLAGYLGAVVSVMVSFVVFRAVGGKSLAKVRFKVVQRLLERLEERPIRTIFLARTLMWLAPALNMLLATSTVRPRDYLIGSALGLLLPIALVVAFFDVLMRLFDAIGAFFPG